MHSSATSIDNPNVDISRLVRLHGPGYDCLEEGTIDFSDTTSIDFLLSARRDAAAAKRFFQKALCSPNHPTPRVINVDKNPSYPPVVEELKAEGTLRRRCRLRPVQYLNNVLEQDHRAIKRRVRASQGFRSFWGAYRTIQGYEAVHAIRKGQARWVVRLSANSISSLGCSRL